MASIKMVARQAGVSTATVSRVLNGHPSCSDEVKTRVNQAIEELGYQPNNIAKSLRLSRTGTIITVVNDIRNPVFADIIRGVEDAAFQQGYSMLVGNSGASRQREASYLQYFHSRRVDGIVLVTPRAPMEEILELAQRVPMVLINEPRPQDKIPCVGINDFAAMQEVTAYVATKGYDGVAYITGDGKTGVAQRRLEGFTQRAEALGLRYTVVAGGSGFQHGYDGMAAIMAMPERYACVLCYNDEVAMGAMQYARERGVDIPGEMAFCGFDDVPAARFLAPALTTVSQPTYDVGSRAAELLLGQLGGNTPAQQRVNMPYKLCIRGSA